MRAVLGAAVSTRATLRGSAHIRGNAGFITQNLSEALDIFIGDYLRVNAEACG